VELIYLKHGHPVLTELLQHKEELGVDQGPQGLQAPSVKGAPAALPSHLAQSDTTKPYAFAMEHHAICKVFKAEYPESELPKCLRLLGFKFLLVALFQSSIGCGEYLLC
jgi:hypothetical protein